MADIADKSAENPPQSQEVAALAPEVAAVVAAKIDEAFGAESGTELAIVEKQLKSLDSDVPPNAAIPTAAIEPLRAVLRSLWNFFRAIDFIGREANFSAALPLLGEATRGFDAAMQGELRDLAIGLGTYCQACIELQNKNIGEAEQLMAKMTDYLRNAGKYGSEYEVFIAHAEPDAFFISAVKAFTELDYAGAEGLINRASQAAERVAHNYYDSGSPQDYTFRGMAQFYIAFYRLFRGATEFNSFQYDAILADDAARPAKKAKELLNHGDPENAITRNAIALSSAILLLLEVYRELAKLMQNVFRATFTPNLKDLVRLKDTARLANQAASAAGPQAAVLVRYCDQLIAQIDNVERLAKRRTKFARKDFGIYAGMVTCVVFVPLFLITAWTNMALHLGINGTALTGAVLSLSLISGFGYGALRFKGFVSGFLQLGATDKP